MGSFVAVCFHENKFERRIDGKERFTPSMVDEKMITSLNTERTSSSSMFAPMAAEEAFIG
ncbi:hypothetical protein [Marininema mesophilum]|uniref:hypothetical protein n=1 Tax=Marininema mesophilum TaxID=1048340 RepID=UPI00115F8FDC|nr:hypothetical protein [Marininema mesophilum]